MCSTITLKVYFSHQLSCKMIQHQRLGKRAAEGRGVFFLPAGLDFNALQIGPEKGSFMLWLLFERAQ